MAVGMAIVMGFSLQACAALINLGTDSLSNQLLYDSDLEIMWGDATFISGASGQSLMAWADAPSANDDLTISIGWQFYTETKITSVALTAGPGIAVASGLLGDFDVDGDVDGFDLLKWQRGESLSPMSASDFAD